MFIIERSRAIKQWLTWQMSYTVFFSSIVSAWRIQVKYHQANLSMTYN